jgi:predicted metal-dependent HD superfamily phosphohydrolase
VLDCLEKLRAFAAADRAAFLALLFHDAVYVAGRGDNEAKSAALAREVLARHAKLDPRELADIERMILATQHHELESDDDPRVAVVLDVDMSILGAPWPEYRAYADGVRREHALPPERFDVGRAAFLAKLLQAPAIFHTAEGSTRWEAAARENIAREIRSLRTSA